MPLSVQPVQNQGNISSVGPIGQQQTVQPVATPNPAQQTTQAQPVALDPDVVNLAKAIRQAEGGNYQAKGKSGEYGAYQWMPGTWAADSAQYLGQAVPFGTATPAEQNEVAYKKLAAWKAAGYNVGQIASMWNAGGGHPDAYLQNYQGTNSKGVSYNTPAYAKEVATNYQKFKKQAQDTYNPAPFSTTTPGAPAAVTTPQAPATTPVTPTGVNNGKGVGGLLTNLFKPELTGVASGIRAIQSTPSIVKEGVALAKGDHAGAAADDQAANATMNKPLLGVNTLGGNSIKQNLGVALQAGGQAAGTGALAIGAQTAGNEISNNASLPKTITDTVSAMVGAKVASSLLPAMAPYLSRYAGTAFDALPATIQDAMKAVSDGASEAWNKVAGVVNPALNAIDKTASNLPVIGNTVSKILGNTADSEVWDMVSPKGTDVNPDSIQTKKTTFGTKAVSVPVTDNDQALIQVSKPYVVPNDPIATRANIGNAVETKANALIQGTADSKSGMFSPSNYDGLTAQQKIPLAIKNGPEMNQVSNINDFVHTLANDADKNVSGRLAIAKQFRQSINNEFGENIWNKDTPIANYIKGLNTTLNNYAAAGLPNGLLPDGTSFLENMREQSLLFQAQDNIKLPKVGSETSTNLLGKLIKPAKGLIKLGIQGTALGKAIDIGQHFIP
jgi:hypothetical protein